MLLRPERPEIRYQRARRPPRLRNAQRTVLLNVRPDPIPAQAHVAPVALHPHAVRALIRAVVRVAQAAVLLHAQPEPTQVAALAAVVPIPAVAVHAAAALIPAVALAVVEVIQEEVVAHAAVEVIPEVAAVPAQAVPAVLVALSADNKQKRDFRVSFFCSF